MNEHEPTDRNPRDGTFASEKELQELINEWPMKRLVEIWNRLPGVEPVARFTDRKTGTAVALNPEKSVRPTGANVCLNEYCHAELRYPSRGKR
jgi:hypothetical protein